MPKKKHWKGPLQLAVRYFGSQPKLAKAIGYSQGQISYLLLTGEPISWKIAEAVHMATRGEISACHLAPHLWESWDSLPKRLREISAR